MSSEILITASGVGKCYALFDKPIDRLKQMVVRGRRQYYREHWAVRGIDLEIRRGETVGIVGRNGSGKSTLLQMICGTLEPSEGVVDVAGRIAPLLQLGAGFNPEMTGRENVFVNAAILGLTSSEILERFERIVSFADIGDMLERPVKLYSSGMYARLAFAVAIHVDPEILVVDETLAVGDEVFQARCFGRIRQMRDDGVTILFVSHSRGTILELCTRAVLVDEGCLLLDGKPKPVTSAYQKLAFASAEDAQQFREALLQGVAENTDATVTDAARAPERDPARPTATLDPSLLNFDASEWPSYGARISEPKLFDTDGNEVNVLLHDEAYTVEYTVDFSARAFDVGFGMLIKTIQGHELAGLGTHNPANAIDHVSVGTRYRVKLGFINLFAAGVYSINVGCFGTVGDKNRYLHRRIDALAFRVDPPSDSRHVSGYFDISTRSGTASAEIVPAVCHD